MKQNYHIFIIIALCSLLVSNANAQTQEPTSFTERLDSIVNSDGSKRIFEHDAKNRLIKDFNYKDENGELIPSSNGYEYKYNEEGKVLEERCYYNGSLVNITTYSYEGNLRKSTYVSYEGTNVISKGTRIIDMISNNLLLYEDFYYGRNSSGLIDENNSHKEEYTYDNNGNKINEKKYRWENEAWRISEEQQYVYENNGKITNSKYYSWQNNKWGIQKETLYEYDSKGNCTREMRHDWENFKNSCEYQCEYDTIGNCIKVSWYNYADNGQWCLYEESIMEYNSKQMIKRTINVRNERNGDIAYSTRMFEEYDSKGNRVKYNGQVYNNKYDRYGDLTEIVVFFDVDGTMYSHRKTEFSWDSEGNRVVVIYDHNTTYLSSATNTYPWYAKEKHVIKTNDMDGIIEVKAYKYKNSKWNLMYEQLHAESERYGWSKIKDYLDDYNLNDERRMQLPTIYYQKIYDEDEKFISFGNCGGDIKNKYGGYTSYHSWESGCFTWGGNQYNQTMYSKYEDIYNNSSETVTDEYYDDFTPIIQTSYSNGEETSKTTYSYDWNVNAETIASLSKVTSNPHKILSEETINTNGETSFTRYYYSPINTTTSIRNSQATHIGQATIFDVTGKQHNSLQKGLNIINEGGKVRKVIVK